VYYKEAVAALVVYDITRPKTFEAVPKWKADLDTKVSLPDGQPIPVVLLANKVRSIFSFFLFRGFFRVDRRRISGRACAVFFFPVHDLTACESWFAF